MKRPILLPAVALLSLAGFALPAHASRHHGSTSLPVQNVAGRHAQIGEASWYGAWHAGRLTANGERFNPNELTAAHRTLPMNTRVMVKNLRNGRIVIVRINDRLPPHSPRIIDLTRHAAAELGMERRGHGLVLVEDLGTPRR